MLRSGRVLYEDDLLPMHYSPDVQPGDIMTGWEIIAGLPLEEQINRTAFQVCCHAYKTINPKRWNVDSLCMLYRWNGESWEVVE